MQEALEEYDSSQSEEAGFDSQPQEKFLARAIKPICFGDRSASSAEIAFISTISHTASNYPVQHISEPGALKSFQQAEALRLCQSGDELTLVELPGSSATPLSLSDKGWQDTREFARELNFPCIVVTNFAEDCLEKLLVHAEYLKAGGLDITGMVVVKTETHTQTTLSEFALIALQEKVGAPLLGILEHSPSISVPQVRQGNLIKTTSAALDLLPILKLLNLAIAI